MSWRRTCPNCQAHYGGLVHNSCNLCLGEGTIFLSDAACAEDDPHTVARGVSMFVGWIIQEPEGESRAKSLGEARKVLGRAGLIAKRDHISALRLPADDSDEPTEIGKRRMTRDAARLVGDFDPPAPKGAPITDLNDYARKRRTPE